MRAGRRRITVIANIPPDCAEEDLADFIESALACWGGQRDPDDPLFDSLDVESVQIGSKGRVWGYPVERLKNGTNY